MVGGSLNSTSIAQKLRDNIGDHVTNLLSAVGMSKGTPGRGLTGVSKGTPGRGLTGVESTLQMQIKNAVDEEVCMHVYTPVCMDVCVSVCVCVCVYVVGIREGCRCRLK